MNYNRSIACLLQLEPVGLFGREAYTVRLFSIRVWVAGREAYPVRLFSIKS